MAVLYFNSKAPQRLSSHKDLKKLRGKSKAEIKKLEQDLLIKQKAELDAFDVHQQPSVSCPQNLLI